jgi:hypothetical protein
MQARWVGASAAATALALAAAIILGYYYSVVIAAVGSASSGSAMGRTNIRNEEVVGYFPNYGDGK